AIRIQAKQAPLLILVSLLAYVPAILLVLGERKKTTGRWLVSILVSLRGSNFVQYTALIEEYTPRIDYTQHRQTEPSPSAQVALLLHQRAGAWTQMRQQLV